MRCPFYPLWMWNDLTKSLYISVTHISLTFPHFSSFWAFFWKIKHILPQKKNLHHHLHHQFRPSNNHSQTFWSLNFLKLRCYRSAMICRGWYNSKGPLHYQLLMKISGPLWMPGLLIWWTLSAKSVSRSKLLHLSITSQLCTLLRKIKLLFCI